MPIVAKKVRGGASILMLLSLVLANLANLGIQLLIPRLLAPPEYTHFAMSWASGQLVAAVLFEWLRIGVVRYSASSDDSRRLSETLGALYATVFIIAGSLAGLLMLVGATGGAIFTSGFVLFYACAQGAFDGQQASLRAKFLNVRFSVTWMARSVLSFALTMFAASAFASGRLALAALIGSFVVVSVFAGLPARRVCWPARSNVLFLLKFGMFAAAAGIVSFALPLCARYAIVLFAGSSGSAGAVLAIEVAQKILMAFGTAINLVLFQSVIRRVGSEPKEGSRYMAGHLVNVVALFSLAMAVLVYINTFFVARLVPQAFLDSYSKVSALAVLSIVLTCLKSYALDALFTLGGRTGYSVFTSMVSLIAFLLGCSVLYLGGWVGITSILVVLSISLFTGLVLSAWFAIYRLSVDIPWAMLSRVFLVTVGVTALIMLLAKLGGFPVQVVGIALIVSLILLGYRVLGVGGPRQWLGVS